MVGIVSCYFKLNYGSVLQAFATQEILEFLGHKCETVDISGIRKSIDAKKLKYYIRNILNVPMYKAKKGFVCHRLQRKIDPKEFGANIKIRQKSFEKFTAKHICFSKKHQSISGLSDACKLYSSVLLGSDQLWLPHNIEADYYTLNFVPGNVNKITYATSFGVSSLPSYQHSKSRNFLQRIEHISVREQAGQKIVKELTGREVPIVCDPTLLFTPQQWEEYIMPQPIVKEPYILCYFLGNNKAHRKFANALKQKTAYKMVALQHLDEFIPSDNNFGDAKPYDIDALDFLNLLKNAEYICTDSFHATALSILFRKEFFTFKRFASGGRESTNNRLESLLDILNLNDRVRQGDESMCSIGRQIQYTKTENILNNWRKESLSFLVNALDAGGER